jgi:transcriptional regulator with XRE-family HTH domain
MSEFDDGEALWHLGDWIARWRAAVGVSQRRLSRLAGISQGGLSRVERGMQACGARRLARLILWLDILSEQSPMRRIDPPPIRRRDPRQDVLEWSADDIEPPLTRW